MKTRSKRFKRKIGIVFCVSIGIAIIAVSLVVFLFPGFTRSVIADFRHSTWTEFSDQYLFLKYYAKYYGLLQDDDGDGFYDLPASDERPGWSDVDKGKLHYHRGEFDAAVDRFLAAIDDTGESESKLFWLGASYLRVGESSNCLCRLAPGTGEAAGPQILDGTTVCSLPITTPHVSTDASERATAVFIHLLDVYDHENTLYQWLLNFSCMSNGTWPEGVPSRYQLKSTFTDLFYGTRAKENEKMAGPIRFHDGARQLGVALLDAGKGVAVEDFDRDGYLDIVTGGTFSDLKYFRNDRGRSFVDETERAGLDGIAQCYVITSADYDNDGWIDILVSRPFAHPVLMRNAGDGTFEDVTLSSGLLPRIPTQHEAEYTCVSAWGDVNRDGYLDLFLAQFGQHLPMTRGLLARNPNASRLLINEKGRFRDANKDFGLQKLVDDANFIGASFGDYDRDGWTDLFLSSLTREETVLLRNLEGRSFEATSLIHNTDPGFMTTFVDVNHDGMLDLFQATQAPARTTVDKVIFNKSPGRLTNKIYLQNKTGRFETHPEFFSDGMHISTMGVSFGDVNNDGCWDFYLGTGNPEGWNMMPNLFYLGNSEGTGCTGEMVNVSNLNGLATLQKGHGIVFFDFDNDGDQDIYSSLGGMWPGDAWPNQLLINTGDQAAIHSWVRLRLRGRKTNYYGVGCLIRIRGIDAGGRRITRWFHMDNKTGFGSSPYIAHIGLIDAVDLEPVEVFWPVSNQVRSYDGLSLKSLHVLDESEGQVQDGGVALDERK